MRSIQFKFCSSSVCGIMSSTWVKHRTVLELTDTEAVVEEHRTVVWCQLVELSSENCSCQWTSPELRRSLKSVGLLGWWTCNRRRSVPSHSKPAPYTFRSLHLFHNTQSAFWKLLTSDIFLLVWFPILANCLIYSWALLEYVILYCCWSFECVFSKMLPSVKFAEDKVLVFVILSEKCQNSATLSLTLISRADWSDKS